MAKVRAIQSLSLAALMSAFVLGAAACSDAPKGIRSAEKKPVVDADADADPEETPSIETEEGTFSGAGASSIEVYGETVFPLLRNNCGSCHGAAINPKFAVTDVADSHKTLVDNSKVNFVDAAKSRVVERLKVDNHQCWTSCDKDSAAMLAAVQKWIASRSKNNGAAAIIKSPEVAISSKVTIAPVLGASTFVLEAEPVGTPAAVTLRAPSANTVGADASGGRFVLMARGNASATVPLTEAQATATGGLITASFTLTEAGKYRVLGRIQSIAPQDDEMYLRIDSGAGAVLFPSRIWKIPQTGPTSWFWSSATNGANLSTLSEFDLQPGAHRVVIMQREFGAKVDRLVLTKDALFRSPDPSDVMTFDLSSLLGGENVKLEIVIEDFNAQVYKIRNPRIITASKKIKVKNMFILVNGVQDNANSSYSVVDTEVSAPGGIISSAATTVLKANGPAQDKLSFSFEVLQVVP